MPKPAAFQPLDGLEPLITTRLTYEWIACFDSYEPGEPFGVGATEQAAIADLLDQTEPV